MLEKERTYRYIIYSFFLTLTAGLLIALNNSSPSFHTIFIAIYLIVVFTGVYLSKDIITLDAIYNDLNPQQFFEKRRIEKIRKLEEKKTLLLLELEEKETRLAELIKHVSLKFENKKQSVSKALTEFNEIRSRDTYLSTYDFKKWEEKHRSLYPVVELFFELQDTPISYESSMINLRNIFNDNQQIISTRNQKYVQQELELYKDYFDTVEKFPLTAKQREAIVIDEHRNLVVAGAGTGKTSTLIGKVGYLLKKELVKPEELLLLSFGRDPKTEMQQRIQEKFNVNIDINTFHSLGMKIIAEARDEKPSVTPLYDNPLLQQFIAQVIEDKKQIPAFLTKLNKFFLAQTEYKSLWEFQSQNEYHKHLKENEVRSLNGERVKSYEELEIANYLYTNGIQYEYEAKYQHPTANKLYGQYTPDFYLTEYDIYIEHFGIDRNGNTAPYVPREKYNNEIEWKRETHEEYETKLIETYSYEKMEGNLLENLREKLEKEGVQFNQIDESRIFQKLNDLGMVQPFTQLVSTFINLYKSSGLNISQLVQNAETHPTPSRAKAFIDIFETILESYDDHLRDQNDIDFNDMINKSTHYIESGKVQTDYKYIMVDEFQDISQSRNRLLLSLLRQNPECKLFCVGDDWQSIYRFTGSDLNIMTDFHEYFGEHASLILDKTFRFNNQICDFSTLFIEKNPKQIKKTLKTNTHIETPQITLMPTSDYESTIRQLIQKNPSNNETTFILGRYRHNKPKHLPRNTRYLTAHKSKGTEADYVIITNLESGKLGFPCNITDDPLLSLVLAKGESYPYAEERRLFYVAVTRAKKHVFLLYNPDHLSPFIKEILDEQYPVISQTSERKPIGVCPRCNGEIILVNGSYSDFLACSNFPYCDYKTPSCPVCLEGNLILNGEYFECDKCGNRIRRCSDCLEGYEVLRKGYSKFWGCSNFPDCQHTKKIS